MIFEFPLSQNYRHFLRVEATFVQIRKLLESERNESLQAALLLLQNFSDFLSRVDLKTEIIKELEIQSGHYRRLQSNPEVDKVKLESFLAQLRKLHHWAINFSGKIGDSLKHDNFLGAVASKQSLQTGIVSADSPELAVFDFQPAEFKRNYLQKWLATLDGLEKSISVILRLTRELSAFTPSVAPLGDFMIDKVPTNTNLIRIKVDQTKIFPEVSASKHCASIHFYSLDTNLRKLKFRDKIEFTVALCGWRV